MTTLKAVAEAAGVSLKTASRALNAEPYVSAATREKVIQAAQAMGYSPNRAAKSLRTARTQRVTLISDRITSTPYSVDIIRGLEEQLNNAHYELQIVPINDPMELRDKVRSAIAGGADGVIYAAMYHQRIQVNQAFEGVKAVLLNCFDPVSDMPAIVPDDEQGGYLAGRCLLDAGHRKIVVLNLHEAIVASRLRLLGFQRAIDEGGHAGVALRIATAQVGNVRQPRFIVPSALYQALADGFEPSAIFCCNDPLALQCMTYLLAQGLQIPRDLSLLGFDDQRNLTENTLPGLSTVALPYAQMGREAAMTLIQMIEAPEAAHAPRAAIHRVPCHLILRGTTCSHPRKSIAEPFR